jgi:hypothetical protein
VCFRALSLTRSLSHTHTHSLTHSLIRSLAFSLSLARSLTLSIDLVQAASFLFVSERTDGLIGPDAATAPFSLVDGTLCALLAQSPLHFRAYVSVSACVVLITRV